MKRENGGILPQDREMEGVSPNANDHRTRTDDTPPQPDPLSVPVDRFVRRFCDSAIGAFVYPDNATTLVALPRLDDSAGDLICNDAKGVLLQR